jgi:hypothetical protein
MPTAGSLWWLWRHPKARTSPIIFDLVYYKHIFVLNGIQTFHEAKELTNSCTHCRADITVSITPINT